ncbi:MAG: class I SAM-dependent methyltransferase family protein [Euryarchaeota archaeon]|nr:class I SAM-dependent methyltransferase family protein [Euryarchaeota archaeon]
MKTETERLLCVKAAKRRGEAIRQALKERKLLRTDARITADDNFIYLPLIRALTDAELRYIDAAGLLILTREFAISEQRKSIEDIVGFKPSYEVIGDIAVLTEAVNESNEQIVAHALMNRHKNIKVVAKRISPVEGVFRTRRLGIIAGEHRTETMHTENACRFKLDLEKVYFNPRLAGERYRVATQAARSSVKAEEIIDMFAGVGPFSIQIAKRAPQSHVTAIDINPEAIRYLKGNVGLNHVRNIDTVVGDIREIYGKFRNTADRIIMNLPKSAYLFLREALSILNPHGGIIHFYDLESSYSDASNRKSKSLERAIAQAKGRLQVSVQELGEEFRSYSVEMLEARKVKAYAPYAYIIGIDAKVKK